MELLKGAAGGDVGVGGADDDRDAERARATLVQELESATAQLPPSPPKKRTAAQLALQRSPLKRAERRGAPAAPSPSAASSAARATASVDAALKVQRERELDAKRRFAQLQRELLAAKGRGAVSRVAVRNAETGAEMRAMTQNAKLNAKLAGCEAASEEDMARLSVTFNGRMLQLFAEPSLVDQTLPTGRHRLLRPNHLLGAVRRSSRRLDPATPLGPLACPLPATSRSLPPRSLPHPAAYAEPAAYDPSEHWSAAGWCSARRSLPCCFPFLKPVT